MKAKPLFRRMLAEECLATIGRLAAGVAHEVNNPLGGMLTAIDTLKRHAHANPQLVRETLPLIERGLEQIKKTISALLVHSRVQDRAFEPRDAQDIVALLKQDIQRKQIRLDWQNDLTEDLPLPAADIRQILINLLLNAIQAAPEQGWVVCSLKRLADNRLMIRIANNGEKISAARQKTLFEPFVSHSGQGCGLGLWVSGQLIRQLDGDIVLHSDHNQTEFILYLPLRGNNKK